MWIRDLKIIKQSDRGNGIFVTLFELILWNKKTRYHSTVHKDQLTKKDFEEHYKVKDYKYCTLRDAEAKFAMMIKSEVEIKPIKTETNDNTRKEVFPRGYVNADRTV